MVDRKADVVPRVRRFVAETLDGRTLESVLHDAELVATELVTNALLHGAAPVVLRVLVEDETVRVEVSDASRAGLVVGTGRTDTMTGRGLALVGVLARRWGVDPADGGKTVWAELRTGDEDVPELAADDIDAVLAAWDHDADDEVRHSVELGDVPTELLLAAKAHVDNLVREFALTASGAASGATADVPTHLAALIELVTKRFAEARQAIKRQAVRAWQRGEDRTRLVLELPVAAAEAGEDYLAALDEADAYARAARLLTLESPPQHRVFRRWYVEEIVHQLRTVEQGGTPRRAQTFEERLLAELGTVTAAQRASERAARLQAVTAALAAATTPEAVAAVVVSEGVAALGASGGGLLVPGDDGRLVVPGVVGYAEDVVQELRSERLDAELPAAEALRTGVPVWLESPQERDARFPGLRGFEPGTVSICAVPLKVREQVLGALRFSFDSPRLFDEDERLFAVALAAQTAQALDRSRLYDAERRSREDAERAANRLLRLQAVTSELAGARTVEEVADIVVGHAAGSLGGRLAALSVLEGDDTLAVVRVVGAPQDSERRRYSVADEMPASIAVRTRRPFVARGVIELHGRFPDLDVAEEQSLVCVPLLVEADVLGALSVSFPDEHVVDESEIELLETIGRQCALAMSRIGLFQAEREARRRAAFLADASGVLTSSLEPAETATHVTELLVPRLADWAVVYLFDPEQNRPLPAAFAHRDPEVAVRARAMLDAYPLDRQAPGGIAEVLRTGRNIRYERLPDAVRERLETGAFPADHESLIPATGLAVPLAVGGKQVGAVGLARIAGPAYTEDDLRLVEDVAARAAVAVLHAQQFARERDAALTLQRSLLPRTLPRLPGLTFAWRYLPGDTGTFVGGDWYDVIPLGSGAVGLVIGDVMGRGVHAAAVMGQLRATARAYATAHVSPSEVLARLDEAVARLEQGQITTVLYGVLEPATGRFTVASAGHLPPLVVTGDDAAYLAVEPGPPLGVTRMPYVEHTVTLPPDTTLLLYTDGLVEDHHRPVDAGMRALREAVRSVTDPEELCDRALAALGRDTGHDDDTAILAVRLRS